MTVSNMIATLLATDAPHIRGAQRMRSRCWSSRNWPLPVFDEQHVDGVRHELLHRGLPLGGESFWLAPRSDTSF